MIRYDYTIAKKLHGSIEIDMPLQEWEQLNEERKKQVVLSHIYDDLNIEYKKAED